MPMTSLGMRMMDRTGACHTSNVGNRDDWRCYEGGTVQYAEDTTAPNGHVPSAAKLKQTV